MLNRCLWILRSLLRGPRSAFALLLAGHLPMVAAHYLSSWEYPLYGAMLPATAGAIYLMVRRCGGRVETGSVLGFGLIVADLALVSGGIWTGSAWLVSAGAVCCVGAWLCSRGALTEPRWMVSVVVLLLLIVRLPPGLDERMQRSFDERVTRTAGAILNTTGVLHYRQSDEIRMERVSLRPAAARGGFASAWLLPVLACVFSALRGRSVVHQVLMLCLSVVLGLMTSVANTVLAAHLAVWFEVDVSSGLLSFFYRLNWLVPGAMLVWSGDRLMKFLLDGIPEMERTVAGRLQRVGESEDGELVVSARNPVILFWNRQVAPWPASVAAGVVSAPVYYGQASAHRTVRPGSRRARVASSESASVTGNRGSGVNYLSGPAVVVALLLAIAQLVRLLGQGVGGQ